MESNWRWNVYELGMSGSDWELAARVSTIPFALVYVVRREGSNLGWTYQVLAPGQLPTLLGSFVPTAGNENFPFGRSVFPD